jgi:hypothetical protein
LAVLFNQLVHYLIAKSAEEEVCELDTPILRSFEVYTKHNIGEMLPGAVTPLTFSTFGFCLDVAMRAFYEGHTKTTQTVVEILKQRKAVTTTGNRTTTPVDGRSLYSYYTFEFIGMFSGHLFLNLTQLYTVITKLLGGSKESLDFSICGYVTNVPLPPSSTPSMCNCFLLDRLIFALSSPFRFWSKLRNTIRFLWNLFTVSRRIDALHGLVHAYQCHESVNISKDEARKSHQRVAYVKPNYKVSSFFLVFT